MWRGVKFQKPKKDKGELYAAEQRDILLLQFGGSSIFNVMCGAYINLLLLDIL